MIILFVRRFCGSWSAVRIVVVVIAADVWL